MAHDPVVSPDHYTWMPEIDCLDVAKHFDYCSGAAIKYIWRSGRKGNKQDALEDLRKAIFYLNREIEFRITEEREAKTRMVDGKEVTKL